MIQYGNACYTNNNNLFKWFLICIIHKCAKLSAIVVFLSSRKMINDSTKKRFCNSGERNPRSALQCRAEGNNCRTPTMSGGAQLTRYCPTPLSASYCGSNSACNASLTLHSYAAHPSSCLMYNSSRVFPFPLPSSLIHSQWILFAQFRCICQPVMCMKS